MTREEAIKNIKEHCYFANLIPQGKEAFDMAIKALEQEPCEDCVSREEVHNLIIPWLNGYLLDETREALETIDYKIGDLPPVTPQPETVLYSGDGYADGYMVYDMAECPNCGYEYEEGDKDWKLPFCPNCGQSLNWESEGE